MGAGWAGIKSVASNLTKTTKDIMGALLKGLGLIALWWLIDWLSKQDFQKLYTEIKSFWTDFDVKLRGWIADLRAWLNSSTIGSIVLSLVDTLVEFDGVIGGIWTTVKTWKTVAWIANFAGSSLSLLWNGIKFIFGLGGLIAGIAGTVGKWGLTTMFNLTTGALGMLWSAVKAVFGPISPMKTSAINVEGWNKSNMFTKEGALAKLMRNIRSIFGVEGVIVKFLTTAGGNWNPLTWFGEEGAASKLFRRIRNAFGAEGAIGKFLKAGGNWNPLNWFGKEGAIGKLFATISGAFGPEGRFATAGTWIGEKWNKIKGFFSTGKEGGPISKIMGFFGKISTSISGAWTNMKSAKWFTGLQKVLTGAKGVVGALLTPLRFLLMPLTWVLGIGAAVWGFVQGFLGKEGVKDERSLGTKIMDGLKGAFRGLLDFFVIDLVMMVQDVMNWFVDQWNNSIFGKVKQFGKFTFGEELRETTDKMLEPSQGSKLEVRKASLNVDDLLEKSGGELVDKKGIGTGDKFVMTTEQFGAMVDKLGVGGLAQVQERLMEMDANKNVDLINKDALIARLQEEVAERAAAAQPTIIDNSSITDNTSRSQQTIAANASSTDPTSQKNQLKET